MFFIFLFVFCVFKEEFNFWLHLKKKSKQGDMQKQSSSTWMPFYRLTLCGFVWKNIYNLIVYEKEIYIRLHSCRKNFALQNFMFLCDL